MLWAGGLWQVCACRESPLCRRLGVYELTGLMLGIPTCILETFAFASTSSAAALRIWAQLTRLLDCIWLGNTQCPLQHVQPASPKRQ